MSDPKDAPDSASEPAQDQTNSALFAQLILQQSNMALMLLGRVAHPESGKVVKDLEAARLFIDQLEMLQVKTRGNLNKEEDSLLKQSLMTLRLAFVEAAAEPAPKPAEPKSQTPKPEEPTAAPPPSSAAAEEEHRKKFSKKY